jgi:L-2-hydroxyglutarate oxidase LhgO
LGISVGISLLSQNPKLNVVVLEKESGLGFHASGRNSGVLHAGFYYSPDSLKAKFCKEGNARLLHYIKKYEVPYKNVGKVVIAKSDSESKILEKLYQRGITNGVTLDILDKSELVKIEPLAKTSRDFLWSPTTGISDPQLMLKALVREFESLGGRIEFNSTITFNEVLQVNGIAFHCDHLINAAGVHSLELAKQMGFGSKYRVMPFLGTYRKVNHDKLPLRRLVYPVPHPVNPFLGVHFTLTIDGQVKIGPTAIPIAGREQYSFTEGWSGSDIAQALKGMKSLVTGDSHDFGAILKSEWPKIIQKLLVKESTELVPSAIGVRDWHRKPPGIRAQLVHLPTGKLEQDFIVTSQSNATHILNAVSPGWTSSIPFGRYVATNTILPKLS